MCQPRYVTDEEIEALLNASDDNCPDLSGPSDDETYEPQEVGDGNDEELYSPDSDSDIEEENDNELNDVSENRCPFFTSKDGILWQPEPFQNQIGRMRTENVVSLTPGTTRYAKARVYGIKDAFLLFFPPHIENIILKHSNAFAEAQYGENYTKIDANLLEAYIGVLILAGVYRLVITAVFFQINLLFRFGL